jgi:TldD protein
MSDSLDIARDLILKPGGLDVSRLDGALSQVMSSSIDSADLYFQVSREESWALEDGIVKEGSASIEQGVGVRAVAGEKTGFAYSDEIVLPALEEASRAARAIALRGSDRAPHGVVPSGGHDLYLPIDPVSSLTSSEKV